MPQTSDQLRADAMAIWRAGVEAVRPARLMRDAVQPDGNHLLIDGEPIELTKVGRLVVVGAGKAGAGMAIAMEEILGPQILREKQVAGWINVPADCVVETTCIHLHAARPAGVNEPTAEGAYGARQIVDLVAGLEPSDLCICLISGGGSALLPAPIEGFPLADKVDLTREIAARGGSIEQLNAVRRELSEVKGGGLARRCGAGRLYTLILSDVLGDDLATIASGPTVLRRPTPQLAIDTLAELGLSDHPAGRHAIELLTERRKAQSQGDAPHMRPELHVRNTVIGNNATAVDAAGIEAEKRGYLHAMTSTTSPEGPVEDVAAHLSQLALSMRDSAEPDCLISGGEPTVKLADPEIRGKGGRNQQLCLAALTHVSDWRGMTILSGGTDGEDGPTDAAGAVVDEAIATAAAQLGLDALDFLRRNDAYHFFAKLGGLVKTGPTNTNVCDLRVVVVDRPS